MPIIIILTVACFIYMFIKSPAIAMLIFFLSILISSFED